MSANNSSKGRSAFMAEVDDSNFGRPDERAEFTRTHNEFFERFHNLTSLTEIAFIREYPAQITTADHVILSLSKICLDNFTEVMLLCVNRFGDGAFVLIRSMFEKLVCARYLHMYPDKAESFMKFFFVQMRTVKNQIEQTFGAEFIPDQFQNSR